MSYPNTPEHSPRSQPFPHTVTMLPPEPTSTPQPPTFPVRLIRPRTKLQLSREARQAWEEHGGPLQTVEEESEDKEKVTATSDVVLAEISNLSTPTDARIISVDKSATFGSDNRLLKVAENVTISRLDEESTASINLGKRITTASSDRQSEPEPAIPIVNPISLAKKMEVSEEAKVAAQPVIEFTEEMDLPENIGVFLLESCLTGSWTSVENQLKILDKAYRFDGKREDIVKTVNLADEESGMNALMLCVKENRLSDVVMLTKFGANVNAVSKAGETVLHIAAQFATDEVVQTLFNLGADPTTPDANVNRLPLHMACLRKTAPWPVVHFLASVSGSEAKVFEDKEGCIPIWLAAETGNVHLVKELLIDHVPEQLSHQNKVQTGDTVMHSVIRRKDTDMLRALLEAGAPVDIQNFDGQTLLHVATQAENQDILSILYDYRANPELTDKYERTALHLAVEHGITSAVETLTEKFKGSIMARTSDGSTLAHLAALTGHPEATLALLKRGVPLNMPNKSGALALHAAARTGHARVVGLLIENGSAVDAKTNDNYTALHLAVEYGKAHVTEALLGYGASVDVKGGSAEETPLHIAARVPAGELCAEMLIKSGADVNATMQSGETALHVAAKCGSLRMVQILLAEGANTGATGKGGETPLLAAVRSCNYYVAKELLEHIAGNSSRADAVAMVNTQNQEGESAMHYATEVTTDMTHFPTEDVKIIQLLLDFNADINLQTKMSGETPIHYCARCGNVEVLTAVIKYLGTSKVQIALNKQAKNGWSALLTASEHGHEDIVKHLLRNNARVDVFDEAGKAALHIAAENGHLDIVDLLLRHKAFVNAKSKQGITPLHLAAMKGWTEIVQVLVEKYEAAIDALSLAKRTPLHMAAQYGKLAICDVLLRMKADPGAKDQKGQTPLHLAAETDHSAIVELFLNAQAASNPMAMVDENGYTVAHIAAKNGSKDVVRLLIHFNKEQVISAKIKTDDSTAVHLAAAGGHAEVLKILIDGGASPMDENGDGMTPLHLAAKFGYLSVLDVLKDTVSLQMCSVKTGFTALHLAAYYGQADFARELLMSVSATVLSEQPTSNNAIVKEIGAEPGLTPLHLACHSGQENLVRLLLNYPGVQVDSAAENTGMIPLHLAAMNGHISIVGLLLSKSGSQMDIRDKKGRNALMFAATSGHEEMSALLIGQGADVSAEDNNAWTALHYAAKSGHLKVVKLLIETGASPIVLSKDGKIAMCYAANAQKTDVLTYLILKDHDCFQLLQDRTFLLDLMNCGKLFHQKALEDFITTSPSPVEIALKLSRFYSEESVREKEMERDLMVASKFCETLGNDLLIISCNRFNPAIVLRATDQYDKSLMDILIDGVHKEVVSEPAVQRYLTDVWYGNEEWSDMKSTFMFLSFLLIPPMWLIFSLPLGHKYTHVPFMKLIVHIVSHLFFIIALILVFMSPFQKLYLRNSAMLTWEEWVLLFWLVGKFTDEFLTAEERKGLGWIRVIVLVFSGAAIIMHIIAFPFHEPMQAILLYVRNQLFATASLFACIQIVKYKEYFRDFLALTTSLIIFSYLSFHYMFGPMGIIIRDLVKDLMRFLVVLALFMLGFSFSSSAMFLDTENSNTTNGYHYPNQFVIMDMAHDPLLSFQYLYFAIFGLMNPEEIPEAPHSPEFSATLIKILLMIYLMVTMVVLINLLIAMLSDTYQRIQARSDLEWKYGRAKLIMNMDKAAISPPPINVITILGTVIFKKMKICLKKMKRGDGGADSTEELVEKISSAGDSRIMSWRKSFVSSAEGGAVQNIRKLPVKRLVEAIDWSSIVSAYRGGSVSDYEPENTALALENEV